MDSQNIRFVNTGIVSSNIKELAKFYIDVFGCKYAFPQRVLPEYSSVQIKLPGQDYRNAPTIELIQYHNMTQNSAQQINSPGVKKLTFDVRNIANIQKKVEKSGGQSLGQVQKHIITGEGILSTVLVLDPENNIIELQHWDPLPKNSEFEQKKKDDFMNVEFIPSNSKAQQIASQTKMGIKKNNAQINQDSVYLNPKFNFNNQKMLFGVFDGHGPNGHYASQFVRDTLPQSLIDFSNIKETDILDSRQALSKAFEKTNNLLFKNSDIDVQLSGTTAVIVYIRDNLLFCANLGDSKAMAAKNNALGWQVQLLSMEHKPEKVTEKARIERAGGRVEPEKNNPNGPLRIWLPHIQAPGLGISRCFGDFMAREAGLIAEPEILDFELTSEYKFLILGSDGLFEFMTNQKVLEFVLFFYKQMDSNPNAAQEAADKLVNQAYQQWVKQDKYIDDITALIIFFKSNTQGLNPQVGQQSQQVPYKRDQMQGSQQMPFIDHNQQQNFIQQQQDKIRQQQQYGDLQGNQSQQYVPQNADLQRQLREQQQRQQNNYQDQGSQDYRY